MSRHLASRVAVIAQCFVAAAALAVSCGACGSTVKTSGGASPGASSPPAGQSSGGSTSASPSAAPFTQSVKGAKPGDVFTVATLADAVPGCAISGNRVVWLAPGSGGTSELHLEDLSTGQEQTVASNVLGSPAIGGDLVVWNVAAADKTTDVAGRDLATGADFSICTAPGEQLAPRVSNGMVVWEDWRNGRRAGSDIYGWRLTDRKEFAVCTDPGPQWTPAIDGDLVAWASFDPASPNGVAPGTDQTPGIFAKNLASGETTTVESTSPGAEFPGVSGTVVLWKDMSGTPALLGRNMANGKFLTVQKPWLAGMDLGTRTAPFAVADGLVASTTNDLKAGKPLGSLQIKDLATGKTWTAGTACTSPAVSGDLVVWCEVSPSDPSKAIAVKGMWIDR